MLNFAAVIKFIIFFIFIMGSLGLEVVLLNGYSKYIQRIKPGYSLWKYLYFFVAPLLIVLYFIQNTEINFLRVTLGFALVGTAAEWLLGFFYDKIIGQRLWTYHHHPITKYTSWLSIPLWGLAGSIFYLFIQIFIWFSLSAHPKSKFGHNTSN